MDKTIIIANFDNTLTNNDTTVSLAIFCAKRAKKQRLLPMFYGCVLMRKVGLVSSKYLQLLSFRWFYPKTRSVFDNLCYEFAQTVKLNDIGKMITENKDAIIVSSSLKSYVQFVFPAHKVIATEIKSNGHNDIFGIEYYSEKEMIEMLKKQRITVIDELYTNPKTYSTLCKIARKTHWTKSGKIVKTTIQ